MKSHCSQCKRFMELYYHWKDGRLALKADFCSKKCAITWGINAYLELDKRGLIQNMPLSIK